MKKSLCLIVVLCSLLSVSAQKKTSYRFHGKPEYYLQVQGEKMFEVVNEGLNTYPPVVGNDLNRRVTLSALDMLLHDTGNDMTEAFSRFVDSRLNGVIADLKKPHKKGLKIYKVYNEAMIASTKSVNIAFDFARCRCRGHKVPLLPNEKVDEIVKMCDVLFLSHNHGDHVDRYVVEQFIKAGKPVVATPEILVGMQGVTHLRNDDKAETFSVQLKNGKTLSVTIHPGHQDKFQNNIYAIATPEKYVVCHTGDQYHKEDIKWYADVKKISPRIDALIVNCWTNSLDKLLAGFNPRYAITGHENEMGHSIDHREAFWLTFEKFEPLPHDYVVLAWGEWFTIK